MLTDNNNGVEAGGTGAGNSIEYNKIASTTAADTVPTGIVTPGGVIGWVAHISIFVQGASSQGIVCYGSCVSGTNFKDNAVSAASKAFYSDNSAVSVNGNVFNGPVRGVTLDATNSTALIQWVAPPAHLHEVASSPTVDHGVVTNFATDIEGKPVPDVAGTLSDTGAYEF